MLFLSHLTKLGISYCLIVVRVSGNVHQSTHPGTGDMLVGSRVNAISKSGQNTDKPAPRKLSEITVEMNVERISDYSADSEAKSPFDYPSMA